MSTSQPNETRANPAASDGENPESAHSSASAYAEAGVDLDRDEGFVEDIAEITRPTLRPEILSSIGGFAGIFKAPERYANPVFVACNDGVGTKLKLASQLDRYDTVGIDCVAMVVNDMIVQGAEPLVFLDYLAMASLDTEIARQTLRGIAEGCRRAGCGLLGGETASMPGVYRDGDIELVGMGVGVVERETVIDGSTISKGDTVLGLASSGCHSNGFSLVRKILESTGEGEGLDLRAQNDELDTSIGGSLLTPTRIYVKPILNVLRDFTVKGMVHITGGGFSGNIPRVLPKSVRTRVDPLSWPRPPIFGLLQRLGGISDEEMLRVFNCGIGMALIVEPDLVGDITERLVALGERAYPIGEVEAKGDREAPLLFDPGSIRNT